MKPIITINVHLDDIEGGHRVVVEVYFFKWLVLKEEKHFFDALFG